MSDNEKKIKVTVYLDPALVKAIKHEGVDRDMSLGLLIEEAFNTRTVALWKNRGGEST